MIYINYFSSKKVYFDMNLYKTLKIQHSKFLIVKYIFSNYCDFTEIINIKEILQDILKFQLIDLIKQMIMINNHVIVEYLLFNKSIKLQSKDYKQLQTFASGLNFIDCVKILFKYESQDMMY